MKMLKDKSLLITFLLLFIQLSVFGQDLILSGTISDADTNEPLPGATVVIEGTNTGAISDFDGKYTIRVAVGNTLSFSSIGYKMETRVISQADQLNISLTPNNELDEIVVVGCRSQKRSNIVGSGATVNVDKATQNPTTNV